MLHADIGTMLYMPTCSATAGYLAAQIKACCGELQVIAQVLSPPVMQQHQQSNDNIWDNAKRRGVQPVLRTGRQVPSGQLGLLRI